jgi:hypothetical protein
VPEPRLDDVELDTGLEQVHGQLCAAWCEG